jgi:hypothetical protein
MRSYSETNCRTLGKSSRPASFLSSADIEELLPIVRDTVLPQLEEVWVLCTDELVPVGFMGLSGGHRSRHFSLTHPTFAAEAVGSCWRMHVDLREHCGWM